jgi:tetratricopeptide (TPR) repeat protein
MKFDTSNIHSDIDLSKKKLYLEQEPLAAIAILENYLHSDNYDLLELLGFAYFQSGNFKQARLVYKKLGKNYQEGYCEILLGNKDRAKELWAKAEATPAISWGLCLTNFIDLEILKRPSYMQIRTFLEKDLTAILKAKQIDYAENIISCGNNLINVNLETYKIIAKSLFNSGFIELSAGYFMKSKSIIDKDPEVYYFLARYYVHMNLPKEAKYFLQKAIDLNNNYWPASRLLKELSNN